MLVFCLSSPALSRVHRSLPRSPSRRRGQSVHPFPCDPEIFDVHRPHDLRQQRPLVREVDHDDGEVLGGEAHDAPHTPGERRERGGVGGEADAVADPEETHDRAGSRTEEGHAGVDARGARKIHRGGVNSARGRDVGRGMNASSVSQPFPKIVRFLETEDSPGAQCPHCGATGRYIHRFVVEGGRTLAAMSGCVKLFPVSRVAVEEARLRKKLEGYRKNYGASARLNRRDTEALESIEAFYRGDGDERGVLAIVDGAKRANSARYR